MEKLKNFDDKKKQNAPFMTAFYWLMGQKGCNQNELASLIGTNGSRISEYKAGKKRVPKELKQKLANAFSDYGRTIYMPYLDGKSQVMLRKNVTDEEIAQNLEMESNPDYDLLHEQKTDHRQNIDQSSLVNAIIASHDKAIAAKDETITALRDELHTKQQTIDTQTEIIAELKQKVDNLLLQINADASKDMLANYPFSLGVADSKKPKQHQ